MYNETLHDRSGSFLYQNIASTKLSEASIEAIRGIFPQWTKLFEFIQDNIRMSAVERWELCDKNYPDQMP